MHCPLLQLSIATEQQLKSIEVFISGWINKMWYIHTMEYYSALKRDEILACVDMDEP
jgi:hypothetical protein